MTEQTTPRWPPTPLKSVGVGVGLGLLCVLLSTLPLLPGPRALAWLGNMMIWGAVFLVFFLMAAIVALPAFGLIAIFSRERRPRATRWLVLCLTVASGVWLGFLCDTTVRRARFAAATARAEPLLRAIEVHHAATGRWPETLESLVPSRLPQIPGTGMMAYPGFKYRTSPADSELFKSYELRIDCPSGGINFDVFVYWPEQGYPRSMYGGWVERIGDWAYVHE